MQLAHGPHRPFSPIRFVWDPQFSVRQTISYAAEDNRLEPDPSETITASFLSFRSSHLDPPDLNFKALAEFLNRSDIRYLRDRTLPARLTRLALLDDRRDPCGLDESQPGQRPTSNGLTRSWTSEQYTRHPPAGLNRYRAALDERGLYDKLCEKRSSNRAERRVLLITNLTPLCALALCVNVARRFHAYFRTYLQRYILNQASESRAQNKTPRDFTMEFHLPYCALRQGNALSDSRRLRRAYPMLPNYDQAQDQLFYHDAQVSVLITGVDEWYWTAYCCVDTFSQEPESADAYIEWNDDGPSGGGREEKYPVWNPREYFLLMLSRRCKQVAREWEVIIYELIARLDTYERAYYGSMDGNDFFDDAQLGRTKSYTKAVSIMRKFNDMLSLSLDTFQDFEHGELQFLGTGIEILDDHWKSYLDSIFDDFAIMRYLQRILIQKIQTFDRMKDGLVNSSALKESRYSTKQGDNIEVLTNMTVAYLPLSLATGLFSMTNDNVGMKRWLFWMMTLLILGLPTFYVAFKGKLQGTEWVLRMAKL